MARQGQHHGDSDDKDKSRGHNNPDKTVDMTAGTPKKQETYQQQAAQHQDTSESHARGGGGAGANWDNDTRVSPDQTTPRPSELDGDRNGSDSNAS